MTERPRKAGRPPVIEETRGHYLRVRMTRWERERAHAKAIRAGIDLSELIRRLLDEYEP